MWFAVSYMNSYIRASGLCVGMAFYHPSYQFGWCHYQESKLLLLPTWQANKQGQGTLTLFGKPADQEDGGLVFQRTILCAVLNCSVVSDSLRLPWTWLTRHLCPRGFSRQEYWSGFPCATSGDLPIPIKIQASLHYQRRGCGGLLQTSWCQNPLFFGSSYRFGYNLAVNLQHNSCYLLFYNFLCEWKVLYL